MAVAHLHLRPVVHAHPAVTAVASAVGVALLAVLVLIAAVLAFALGVEQLTGSGVITLAPSAEPVALEAGPVV